MTCSKGCSYVGVIFILIFTFYVFSLNPVLPTGDAGGLITASYLLGIAHPPGYPIFNELGKLFSFIPFGNIGFRVSLLPAVFSIITLYFVYIVVREFTDKKIYSAIAVLTLGVSYSFYFQTIVAKFYPINAALVVFLTLIGIKILKNGFDMRYAYLSAFLLGLSTGLHHTALFMFVPLLLVGVFSLRKFLKAVPLSALFFLIGFLVNLHTHIRSLKDAFAMTRKHGEILNLFDVLLRKFYKEGESLNAVSSAFSALEGYWNAIKNFLYMLNANFGYVTLIFFILGLIYVYKANKKVFAFLLVAFLMFSVALSKMTFSSTELNEFIVYVIGNQYFIPAFCFYVIFMSLGIKFIVDRLEKFRFISRAVPLVFLLLPIIFIPMRYFQTAQANNWVLYYYSKDILSTLPVSSVIHTYGDNKIMGLWYTKLVGRYRDDICQLAVFRYESMQWSIEACKPTTVYSNLVPEVFEKDIKTLIDKRRYYSVIGLSQYHPLSRIAETRPYGLVYMYFPKGKVTQEDERFIKDLNLKSEKFLTPQYCLTHSTDDPFTFSECRFVSVAYLVFASSVKPKQAWQTLSIDSTIKHGGIPEPFRLKIDIGKENEHYVEINMKMKNYNEKRKGFLLE